MASPSQDLELLNDDSVHSLLDPPLPAYSEVTMRRALIAWIHCGQKTNFQQACKYYHYLEVMEDKLPAEERAKSRHHEFDTCSNNPPTSQFLKEYFPDLYSHSIDSSTINKLDSIATDHCVFKFEGFNEIPQQTKATQKEILETSKSVRNYCKSQMIPLRRFFNEFKQFAKRCELKCTVKNVDDYIKRKTIQSEMDMENNSPKTFSFLESTPTIKNVKMTKPNTCKVNQDFGASDIKLNPTCAAFFNAFNARYIENKSVSCSPLDNCYTFNLPCNNVSSVKYKSRSVESLLGKSINADYHNYSHSLLVNFDQLVDQLVRARQI